MITLDTQASSARTLPTFSAEQTKPTAEVEQTPANKSSVGTQVEGVKVSLSGVGLQKAANERSANANKDIEESGLPDQAQKILKMIRELKQKIAEKQSEMQALMADQSMSPETKQVKVGALQATLSTLTASLMTASASLDKLSKNGTLSAAQAQQVVKLAMKS
ncbi:hypothetical protein LOY67_18275 [Pseudomonas sp. B21-056]|jgi:predicted  nucleic acid-binding Zn-ribbon protein|uniref:hypothetical protein n=1 Tax=Pseudomonas sp. B21-056 TaxID=2895495 RepID=UPI002232B0CA|nr:hypothetical protein [Pseudomonas sp. B21-056]UZE21993.1 hypothetical protein LOY67_18275 [Pseudomonas sp. B21-056]